jgi:hypothetical protein
MSGEYGIIGLGQEFGAGFPSWCGEFHRNARNSSKCGRKGAVDYPQVAVGGDARQFRVAAGAAPDDHHGH